MSALRYFCKKLYDLRWEEVLRIQTIYEPLQEICKILQLECGNVFPVYEAHYESEIKDSLETVSNPFESSESIFMSVSIGKKKNRLNKHQDKNHEIAKEIKSMDLIL